MLVLLNVNCYMYHNNLSWVELNMIFCKFSVNMTVQFLVSFQRIWYFFFCLKTQNNWIPFCRNSWSYNKMNSLIKPMVRIKVHVQVYQLYTYTCTIQQHRKIQRTKTSYTCICTYFYTYDWVQQNSSYFYEYNKILHWRSKLSKVAFKHKELQ